MSTSSTRRVASSFTDVNDATAWLSVEGGGKFDVSISGTWAGVVTLQRRTPPAGTAIDVETYTANTERLGEFASDTEIRLVFTTDTSGTVAAELRVGHGKQR
jgi:hypothetical protein